MAKTERLLHFFSTPVIIGTVEDSETINAELEKCIRARMGTDPGVTKSNRGGWHSKTDLFDWAGPAALRVLDATVELANAHTVGAQGQEVKPRWRPAAWANVSGSSNSNVVHTHSAAYWSAVYYVRVGGSAGHLVLHDPRMPALRMHAPWLRLKDSGPEALARIKPAEGQIILFPSWLSHSVDPWEGDEERISIALNLTAPMPPPARPANQQQPTQRNRKNKK
jgi:uncharacterized protein (TIGR02466 family)